MTEPQTPRDPYESIDLHGVEFAYATNFVTTHTNREFYLTFACLSPDKPNSKNLRCVARVILGPEHMMELITVLKNQVEVFKKLQQGGEGEGGGSRF